MCSGPAADGGVPSPAVVQWNRENKAGTIPSRIPWNEDRSCLPEERSLHIRASSLGIGPTSPRESPKNTKKPMKRVLIIEAQIKRYRKPFYERLHKALGKE